MEMLAGHKTLGLTSRSASFWGGAVAQLFGMQKIPGSVPGIFSKDQVTLKISTWGPEEMLPIWIGKIWFNVREICVFTEQQGY